MSDMYGIFCGSDKQVMLEIPNLLCRPTDEMFTVFTNPLSFQTNQYPNGDDYPHVDELMKWFGAQPDTVKDARSIHFYPVRQLRPEDGHIIHFMEQKAYLWLIKKESTPVIRFRDRPNAVFLNGIVMWPTVRKNIRLRHDTDLCDRSGALLFGLDTEIMAVY